MRSNPWSAFWGAVAMVAAVLLVVPAVSPAANGGSCPNAEFRTGWSAKLPDCRAYELVTPTEFKKGQSLNLSPAPNPSMGNPAPSGDKLIWTIITPVGDSVASTESYIAASRGADGWSGHALTPKACSPEVYGDTSPSYTLSRLSTELTTGLWLESSSPNCDDPNDQAGQDLYLTDPLGQKHWISQNGGVKTVNVTAFVVGASADLSHVFFSTTEQLVPSVDSGRLASARGVYERFAGQTRAVGVGNDGQALNVCGVKATGGTLAGTSTRSKVSPDGRVIYFAAGTGTDPGCAVPNGGGQLYARVDGQHTVHISASELSSPSAPTVAPTMVGTTEDGLSAYFSTTDQLTDDATPGGGLYRYDLRPVVDGAASSGVLSFLTPQATDPGGPTIGRLVGASADGTVIYFQATGDLAPGAPGGQALYRYDEDGVSLVTDNQGASNWFDSSVSRSGRWLAYRGEHANGSRQIYLYDGDSSAAPECVSCPESGPPTRDAQTWVRPPDGGIQRQLDLRMPWVTEDGRVFFTAGERLSPRDVNGVNDVYEYDAGEIELISSGAAGRYGSVLTGTAMDGRDVFFATTDTLLARDRDNGDDDIYVARIGGGFPQPEPPQPFCTGEACQGSAGSTPAAPFIGSVGFGGEIKPANGKRPRAAMRVKRLKATRGAVARLRVRVPAAGRIVVAGHTVRKTRWVATKAGAYPVRVALKARARRLLRNRGRLRVAARVTFRARGGNATSRRVRLVFGMPAKMSRGGNALAVSARAGKAGR